MPDGILGALQGALFFLDDPGPLLGILIGYVVGVVARSAAEAVVADRLGDRQARVAGRISADPRRHLDPFGVVAVLIAGVGWPKPVPFDERRLGRGRFLLTLAVGPVAHLLLALGAFAALRATADTGGRLGFTALLLLFAGLVNVGCAVLALVPLPPLEANRVLWVLAPRSAGWQRARYYSEEQNYGVAVLVILLLPIFSGIGLLMRLVHAVGRPVADGLLALVGL